MRVHVLPTVGYNGEDLPKKGAIFMLPCSIRKGEKLLIFSNLNCCQNTLEDEKDSNLKVAKFK